MKNNEKFSILLAKLMACMEFTQLDLSKFTGISQSRLSKYLSGKELPNLENFLKIISVIGYTGEELFNSIQKKIEEKEMIEQKNKYGNVINGNNQINGNIIAGNFYHNTKVKEVNPYSPSEDDITEEQAFHLKELITKIVELEKEVKIKPKGYAAVWNAFKKYCKVSTYRAIKKSDYARSEAYLNKWNGRLKKTKAFASDEEKYRKDRYRAIHSAARINLKWSKEDIDNYIFDQYQKESMKDLSKLELENLYTRIMNMKQRVKNK